MHILRVLPLFLCLLSGTLLAQKGQALTEAGAIKIVPIVDGLEHPWGMAFLPDGRMLITERPGRLRILEADSTLSEPVAGLPELLAYGQGGLLDVALDPDFADNQYVYLSFSDPGQDSMVSSAFGRGRWVDDHIEDFETLFVQDYKMKGPNHFGGRMEFTGDGMVYFTMGERFQFEPAQDLSNHLGTVVRLNNDGTVPQDNPFADEDGALPEIYSYGHRNIQAAAIDPATGQLWVTEMGPMGGDELNQVHAGENYGWPVVSWGKNYDDTNIPDPTTRPEFADAALYWSPTISPSGMVFYTGDVFAAWRGNALIGGLTAGGLVRVAVNGDEAEELERIPIGARVRDVVQAPDGTLYVLTDADNGQLFHLRPFMDGK
ncbi:PQQ-dependent sugar dehydrogenase [Lewinella sp. IMCC34183]|uniref:PQQ-dependent sugar dehydrogenase n=1 Tax=Lewinella sp. IMCC34183 TaxID=2248762 RepID=UPI000E235D6E|nr:PQQ-dependent sugar dehydrogenase [Lewinella sp. IMCC34183]